MTRTGWRRVVARTEGIEHLLSPLLAELRRDDCVHSWRQRLPKYGYIDSASVVGLLEAEKVRRPTTTFAYVAIGLDGSEHVVAAGAISDRVRANFSYDAFPVLARCFIRSGNPYSCIIFPRIPYDYPFIMPLVLHPLLNRAR